MYWNNGIVSLISCELIKVGFRVALHSLLNPKILYVFTMHTVYANMGVPSVKGFAGRCAFLHARQKEVSTGV